MKRKITKEQVDEIVQLYYVGQSTIRIAQQFKVDISTIAYWLRKEGVNRRSISERNRKYTLNHDYFEKIDSEQKAYFLGLLASDGCIADENKILLSLVITDGYLIESFKKAIGYTGPLFKMTRRNSSHKDMLRLSIRSSKMYNDLFNLGIVPRKSRVLQFPTSKEVPDLLIPHYIRGYLDGDGCVQLHHNLLSIGFVGTKEMMVGIQNNLVQHCAVNNTKLWETNVGSNNNNYTLRFGNQQDCYAIYTYLYKDATIFMLRKRDKIKEQIRAKLRIFNSWILQDIINER